MNPYAPPQTPAPRPDYGLGGTVGTCPRCRGANVYKPTFTWWGGLLGPKLFNHTICRGCGYGFNYKTGKSNATAIGIYLGIGVLLVIVLLAVRASM